MDKITLCYFLVGDPPTLGRGENVKLLLEDAGLEHDYVRIIGDQAWHELRDKLTAEGHPSVTLPYIQIKDQRYFKTPAILRYLSTKLGNKYHGSTPEENQLVDVVCEVVDLWFDSTKTAFWGTDEQKKQHVFETPVHVATFEKFYANCNGPYLLGDKITYADFMVYHMIEDDSARSLLNNAPNLAKLVETFEARPNIKKYLATLS